MIRVLKVLLSFFKNEEPCMVPEGPRGSLPKNVTCPARKHAMSVKNFFFTQQIFRPPANIRAAVVFRPPTNISPPAHKKVFLAEKKVFFWKKRILFVAKRSESVENHTFK